MRERLSLGVSEGRLKGKVFTGITGRIKMTALGQKAKYSD
jgi:hypothetical protein